MTEFAHQNYLIHLPGSSGLSSGLLAWPLLLAVMLFGLAYSSGADFWLADFWYQLQGGAWTLQRHWFFDGLMHQGVRQLNQLLVLALVVYYFYLRWRNRQRQSSALFHQQLHHQQHQQLQHQRAVGVLLQSVLYSLAAVAILKRLLPMDCPWDLTRFGGERQFTGLLTVWPQNQSATACFPAGHASIGYSWLALYFFCRPFGQRQARIALLLALMAGVVLGLVQQIRGAHFLSHDIATASLCWTLAYLTHWYNQRPAKTVSNGVGKTAGIRQPTYPELPINHDGHTGLCLPSPDQEGKLLND